MASVFVCGSTLIPIFSDSGTLTFFSLQLQIAEDDEAKSKANVVVSDVI